MDEGDKIFYKVLSALENEGILKQFIIIGGWCQRLYRYHYNNPPEISALRTADIDMVVHNPKKIIKRVDLSELFNGLGFDEKYSMPEGFIKYVHPQVAIELLVHEVGRGKGRPFPLQKLNTNAQRIRYLDILENHTMDIMFYDLNIDVPQPAAFFINKIITSQRRMTESKREKDLYIVKEMASFILGIDEQKNLVKDIFNNLKPQMRKKVLKIIKNDYEQMYDWLSPNP